MATQDPLALIQQYENAGGDPTLKNQSSSASGLYQMLDGTWQQWAGAVGIDTKTYPTAGSAPVELQHQAAQYGYDTQGFAPWLADPASRTDKGLLGGINQAGGVGAFPSMMSGEPPALGMGSASNSTGGVDANAATSGSALSRILNAIGAAFVRGGVGFVGLALIVVAAWAVARGHDIGGTISRHARRVVA